MTGNNLATLPFLKDKDGDDGDESPTFQVIIDTAQNGFVLSVHGTEDITSKVFLFNGKGEEGPSGLIQEVINQLGIADKVKLEK